MNMAIQLVAALFLIVWATQVKTTGGNFMARFVWKTVPAILSFGLVLTAFKVL